MAPSTFAGSGSILGRWHRTSGRTKSEQDFVQRDVYRSGVSDIGARMISCRARRADCTTMSPATVPYGHFSSTMTFRAARSESGHANDTVHDAFRRARRSEAHSAWAWAKGYSFAINMIPCGVRHRVRGPGGGRCTRPRIQASTASGPYPHFSFLPILAPKGVL